MAGLPLIPQVFTILSGLIEDRSGLHYGPEDRGLLADKVTPRAVEAGFSSLLDYYYFLRYDAVGTLELDALVESLCVHESYFFREADALRVLVREHLEPAVRSGRRPRVWCAAAARGEEPLTLAMMLAEAGLLGSVELVASDISAPALERAQRGLYGQRSLRALPDDILGRWLLPAEGGVEARRELVEAIAWRRVNLNDRASFAGLRPCDAILCRNVLIYFADDTARRIAHALGRILAPGGWLLVGTSESLLRFGTNLLCEERGGAFVYRSAG